MLKNKTKERLQAGETVFGCFVRYPDASIIEFMGHQNWDFLVFDGEHGTLQPRDCENMVRAAELTDVTPIVRATTNQPHIILRFMDTGAQGVHVPWVNSAEEAEAVVRSVKYHPRGVRGLAGSRAANYGQTMSFGEYIEYANRETLVTIHIETAEAVEQLPEIVKVDGLDVIFIGPTDLSHSLGIAGQKQHPELLKALDRIVDITTQSDKYLGIMVGNAEAAKEWQERGAQYITVTTEGLLGGASRSYLQQVRE